MKLSDESHAQAYATYRADRGQLLQIADAAVHQFRAIGPDAFVHMLSTTAPDQTAMTSSIGLAHWYMTGLQSVELSHKLAAALMATSATGALDHARLPWPAFEIRLPAGLLASSHGEIFTCVVHSMPPWVAPRFHRGSGAGVVVLYYDERAIGHISVAKLADVARFEPTAYETELGIMRDVLRAEYDQSREDRVKQLLMRLVTGVILLVNEARADKPEAFPQHPLRPAKRGEPRANTHRLVRPVSIDVTATVRDFALGIGRDSPHVTTLVRGHWRQQAHGPRHTLRRTQWIEPFWRGEGPINVRPTRLRDRDDA